MGSVAHLAPQTANLPLLLDYDPRRSRLWLLFSGTGLESKQALSLGRLISDFVYLLNNTAYPSLYLCFSPQVQSFSVTH